MPHGGPDWGTGGEISTVHTIEDLGELAARLGSINTHDRRGNVIWMDDFESSLNKWDVSMTAGSAARGAGVSITNEYARNGAFSAKLLTGDVQWDEISIDHIMAYTTISKIGFEFSIRREAGLPPLYIFFGGYDGLHTFQSALYWKLGDLSYLGADNAYHALDLYHYWVAYFFFTIKLVIDLKTAKYVRLIINNVSYDLSARSFYWVDTPHTPALIPMVKILTPGVYNCPAYIDDIIITQNEP